MAISTVSDISSILTTAFGPDLVRLWNRRANTLANCVNIKEGEFKNVFWAASSDTSSAKAVAEGYQVQASDFDNDGMIPLTLPRATYLSAFSLSDTEIAVAARSPMSPTKLIDMVAERVFEKATRLTSRMNADLFAGTGTDPLTSAQSLVGLDTALNAAGTYAGQTSVSALASNVSGSDSSPAALTLAQLQADLTAIKLRADEKPDFIVMHPYVGSALQALYETNRRLVNIDQQLTRYSSGPSQAFNGADSGMSFMGVPILYDKDGYASGSPGSGVGHVYYVSKKQLELDVMPHRNPFDGSNWTESGFISAADENSEEFAPMISIVSLARNGLAASFAVCVEAQLKVRNPRAVGIRKGVSF